MVLCVRQGINPAHPTPGTPSLLLNTKLGQPLRHTFLFETHLATSNAFLFFSQFSSVQIDFHFFLFLLLSSQILIALFQQPLITTAQLHKCVKIF